mgnify:CR=1 FL=1
MITYNQWLDYFQLDENGEPVNGDNGQPITIGKEYYFDITVSQFNLDVASSTGIDPQDLEDGVENPPFNQAMYDAFNVTIDQLEGEINVPYQFVNENSVRRIDIPQSILGGFSQFRVNYIFTQHPNSPQTEQGIFVSGHVETDRIFTPAFIPGENVQQTDTFPPIDENYIREVFADKIYDVFFKTLELPSEIDLDYSSLQSTIRDGKIVTGRQENEKLVFYKKDRNLSLIHI